MQNIPYVDVDYCQFSNWGYKNHPCMGWFTCIKFTSKKCPGISCPNVHEVMPQTFRHKERLGGFHQHYGLKQKYQVPKKLIEYLCEWNRQTETVIRMVHELRKMQLKTPRGVLQKATRSKVKNLAKVNY